MKTIALVVASLLLLLGAIAALLLPWTFRARATLFGARARFFAATENVRSLEALRQQLGRLRTQELEGLFVPAQRPLAFIETLEMLAERTGSRISLVFPEIPAAATARRPSGQDEKDAAGDAVSSPSPAEAGIPPERTLEVRLSGTFSGALEFLSALERQPVLLEVREVLSEAIQEQGQAAPKINTTIRLHVPTLE